MAATKTVVKFGTDGWRGIIADDFTYENVRTAAAAIAHYVLEVENGAAKGVCIAYDTRFGSRRFAMLVAETLAGAGVPVAFASGITSTPALSFAVLHRKAAGGVMITSSHNPANWNGVKYKASYGGAGKPSIIPSDRDVPGEAATEGGATAAMDRDRFFIPQYLEAFEPSST